MAEAIRLLDSSGSRVLDSVSTEYEDSFCLEAFADLIEYHAESEPKGRKAFIIARVQTWDPKQPEKAFYSYYNAYQLNKILFQTQIYLGKKLIHRLHVLNPLTNTDIIGNVQYFMVKGSGSFDESVKASSKPEDAKLNVNAPLKTVETNIEASIAKTTAGAKRTPLKLPPPITTAKAGSDFDNSMPLPSPAVKEIESGVSATWTRTAPVVVDISSEIDSGGDMERRKSNFTGFLRRVSQMATPRSIPADHVYTATSPNKTGEPTSKDASAEAVLPPPSQQRRLTSVTPKDIEGFSKAPGTPIRLAQNGISPQSTKLVPAGNITRFCVPLSPSDLSTLTPKTAKSRRRSLSYANSVNASGSSASYSEWLAMVAAEKAQGSMVEDYDIVSPFSAGATFSPKSATIVEVEEEINEKPFFDAAHNNAAPKPVRTFDAVLFATDNDFLESARVRSIFKQNALHPDDAVLFEMKPFTGSEVDSPVVVIVEDNPACEFCYPSPSTLSRASPCMQTFHRIKCYIAALLLILAMFFL
ncbi:hypothetical protein HDU67_001123 [Dinochytrium kinnereticum]|nr:hypothetical protein HDU67_001123 [Dinochytrium kinnereticum]